MKTFCVVMLVSVFACTACNEGSEPPHSRSRTEADDVLMKFGRGGNSGRQKFDEPMPGGEKQTNQKAGKKE